jgi:hypothetical protein
VVARGVARGPVPHNATTDHVGLNVGVGYKTNVYFGRGYSGFCYHHTRQFWGYTRKVS